MSGCMHVTQYWCWAWNYFQPQVGTDWSFTCTSVLSHFCLHVFPMGNPKICLTFATFFVFWDNTTMSSFLVWPCSATSSMHEMCSSVLYTAVQIVNTLCTQLNPVVSLCCHTHCLRCLVCLWIHSDVNKKKKMLYFAWSTQEYKAAKRVAIILLYFMVSLILGRCKFRRCYLAFLLSQLWSIYIYLHSRLFDIFHIALQSQMQLHFHSFIRTPQGLLSLWWASEIAT